MPEDWIASTVTAFNGMSEIAGEGLGRLEDGRLVKDVVGELPILVKLLENTMGIQFFAHGLAVKSYRVSHLHGR